ncbi:hypothetical protein BgiBS90_030817, partial [Biomphalaria glabrata]
MDIAFVRCPRQDHRSTNTHSRNEQSGQYPHSLPTHTAWYYNCFGVTRAGQSYQTTDVQLRKSLSVTIGMGEEGEEPWRHWDMGRPHHSTLDEME